MVAGKPRSGTTSVAAALSILGIKTLHYCPLTSGPNLLSDLINHNKRQDGLYEFDALVSWRLTPYLHYLQSCFSVHKVILMDRADGWESSCSNMGLTAGQVNRIRLDFLEALTLCENNDRIVSTVIKTHELNWERLCFFLGTQIPDVPFPWKNKLEENFQI